MVVERMKDREKERKKKEEANISLDTDWKISLVPRLTGVTVL